MDSYMIYIWASVFILSLILEASTQEFVSIWFSLGSIISFILSFFTPFWVQIIVFSVVSFAALLATRPLVKKLMQRNERYTNTDEFIGKRLITKNEITKYEGGEIKLNGIDYTAILMESEEENISANSLIEIVSFKGNKVVVKKIKE